MNKSTPESIIKEIEEEFSEWIEMTNDPATFVAWVLAKRIIKQSDKIDYLQRRLKYASANYNS